MNFISYYKKQTAAQSQQTESKALHAARTAPLESRDMNGALY